MTGEVTSRLGMIDCFPGWCGQVSLERLRGIAGRSRGSAARSNTRPSESVGSGICERVMDGVTLGMTARASARSSRTCPCLRSAFWNVTRGGDGLDPARVAPLRGLLSDDRQGVAVEEQRR